MGRSNAAARKKNHRLNRRVKGESRQRTPDRTIARIEAEDLIIPDGRCFRNPRHPKAKFNTQKKAAAALKQAQSQRRRAGVAWSKTEKRYYPCPEAEGGCGGYHLTSREEYDPTWKRTKPQEAS